MNRGTMPHHMSDSLPTVDLGLGVLQFRCWLEDSCVLLGDGGVKCWGCQLGQGDTASRGGSAGQMGDALPPIGLCDPADIVTTVRSQHFTPPFASRRTCGLIRLRYSQRLASHQGLLPEDCHPCQSSYRLGCRGFLTKTLITCCSRLS